MLESELSKNASIVCRTLRIAYRMALGLGSQKYLFVFPLMLVSCLYPILMVIMSFNGKEIRSGPINCLKLNDVWEHHKGGDPLVNISCK